MHDWHVVDLRSNAKKIKIKFKRNLKVNYGRIRLKELEMKTCFFLGWFISANYGIDFWRFLAVEEF